MYFFFFYVSDICFSGRLAEAGFCIFSWSISSLLCSSLSSIFLLLLGIFQPIYGASHRPPQLQTSAEKTSTLFLAPPVDARHIRTRGKGEKKQANPLYLELGATATGRCPSPPPLPGSGEHQPNWPQRTGTPSLSALPRSPLCLILSEKSPANICNCREKEHCCLYFFSNLTSIKFSLSVPLGQSSCWAIN